jgi:hypothetical protein
MSISSQTSKLLTNKYVLYFVLFLAVTTVFGYMSMNDTNTVILFILIALVSRIFTKNMIIILGLSILITNLLVVTRTHKEGLENNEQEKQKQTSNSDVPVVEQNTTPTPTPTPASTKENTSNVDGMAPNIDMSNVKKIGKNRIDYASTLEDAYDNLDSILGSDGIKQLTSDTKNLMMKQQELFKSMENMAPMLETAKGMLEGFDMKSLQGLASFAGGFPGSGSGSGSGSDKK